MRLGAIWHLGPIQTQLRGTTLTSAEGLPGMRFARKASPWSECGWQEWRFLLVPAPFSLPSHVTAGSNRVGKDGRGCSFSWSLRLLIHAFWDASTAESWCVLGTELKITLSCCDAPDASTLAGNWTIIPDSRESGKAILGPEKASLFMYRQETGRGCSDQIPSFMPWKGVKSTGRLRWALKVQFAKPGLFIRTHLFVSINIFSKAFL